MVKLDIYAIYVETSERSGQVVDLYNSFEECMKHRMEFANWWCPQGNIWIKHYPGGKSLSPDEEWHIDEKGTIIGHYDWKKYHRSL